MESFSQCMLFSFFFFFPVTRFTVFVVVLWGFAFSCGIFLTRIPWDDFSSNYISWLLEIIMLENTHSFLLLPFSDISILLLCFYLCKMQARCYINKRADFPQGVIHQPRSRPCCNFWEFFKFFPYFFFFFTLSSKFWKIHLKAILL